MQYTSERIAELANVSRSTVSRVINNYPNVPPETRKRVMDIIEKYNYYPNRSARILAGKETTEIALFHTGTRFAGLQSIYSMRLLSELIYATYKYGYTVSICLVNNEEDMRHAESLFSNKEICGGIFLGFEYKMEWINRLIDKKYNIVVIDPDKDMRDVENVKYVVSDNYEAGYMATKHLINLGRKRIGHIRGDGRLSGVYREKGYRKAVEEAGLKFDEELICEGLFDTEHAREGTIKLLKNGVDAIFAASDRMAIGALLEVKKRGFSVPEDICIVGCDYISIYETHTDIHLTTVEMPTSEVASKAVDALLGRNSEHIIYCQAKMRHGDTA